MKTEFILCDSLEKVLPARKPEEMKKRCLRLFKGERAGFFLAYRSNDTEINGRKRYTLSIDTSFEYSIRKASLVADALPTLCFDDDAYLFTEPSLVPDRLDDYPGFFKPLYAQYRALYITLCGDGVKREEEVRITVYDENEERVFSSSISLVYSPFSIPALDIPHTEWMYVDCLADYYGDDVFGERNWECIENNLRFLKEEVGANMIYTPVFTPALDTRVGGERTTAQLVGIRVDNGIYAFDFSLFDRWISLVKKCGFEYIEICHLFSQWGARFSPKVVACVDGKEKRIFGWETESTDERYIELLKLLIPELRKRLNSSGYDDSHIYFHISDEPGEKDIDSYKSAKERILPLLEGCNVFDALSSYELYSKGAVSTPVVSANHIDEFIRKGAEGMWVYYCIGQIKDVPNRFMALPLYRARVLGILMYTHSVRGFLHWGYNFYNTEFSERCINPFSELDAGEAFCPGDAYLVYPGPGRKPVSSLRTEANREAFTDYRKLKALESLRGREYVLSIIREENGGEIPFFTSFFQNKSFVLSVMERVDEVLSSGC